MSIIIYRDDLLSDGTVATSAASQVRELASELATGLGESLYWPGSAASQGNSGASSGELMPGTALTSKVGVAGLELQGPDGSISQAYVQGALEPLSLVQLVHTGSRPFVLGGSNIEEHAEVPDAATPHGSRWLVQEGRQEFFHSTSNTSTFDISYPIQYTFTPMVLTQVAFTDPPFPTSALANIVTLANINSDGFSSTISMISGSVLADTTMELLWRSEGTATWDKI